MSLLISLCGCGAAAVPEEMTEGTVVVNQIRNKFDDVIPSLCLENIGPDVDSVLEAIDADFSQREIPSPYTVFDGNYGGDSQVITFNILDNNKKIVHVRIKSVNQNVSVLCTYDTPQEVKDEMTRLLKEMLGETVYIAIDDTYIDYVYAKAQNQEYRYKDGKLERISR